MKEIFIDVKITNYRDIEFAVEGIIKSDEIKSVNVRGKVDTGSTCLVITPKIFNKLGLRKIGSTPVKYANGKIAIKPVASVVEVEINGRRTVTMPIIEERENVLVGNPIIEAMDFYIAPVEGKLLPRHPELEGPVEIIEERR